MTSEEWMLETYNRIVAEAGTEGIALKDAQSRAAELYEQALESGEIERDAPDAYREGVALFDRVVKPARQSRKSSMIRDMETIVAALNDETILGLEDPILTLAFPLGTTDGRDKVLGLWNREDWRNASMTRYRNAAEVTAAAQEFEEQSSLIADRMLYVGVAITRDLFGRSGGPDEATA